MKISNLLYVGFLVALYGCGNIAVNDKATLSKHGKRDFSRSKRVCMKYAQSALGSLGGKVVNSNKKKMRFVSSKLLYEKKQDVSMNFDGNSATAKEKTKKFKIWVSVSGSKRSCSINVYNFRWFEDGQEVKEVIDLNGTSYVAITAINKYFDEVGSLMDDSLD